MPSAAVLVSRMWFVEVFYLFPIVCHLAYCGDYLLVISFCFSYFSYSFKGLVLYAFRYMADYDVFVAQGGKNWASREGRPQSCDFCPVSIPPGSYSPTILPSSIGYEYCWSLLSFSSWGCPTMAGGPSLQWSLSLRVSWSWSRQGWGCSWWWRSWPRPGTIQCWGWSPLSNSKWQTNAILANNIPRDLPWIEERQIDIEFQRLILWIGTHLIIIITHKKAMRKGVPALRPCAISR